VELENGGGAAYGAGEHWERRVLFEELMTAVAPPAPVLSAITFGLLLDTGWYRLVNSSADLIDLDNDASGMTYGRGLGCAWATQRCDTWPQALNSSAAESDAVGAGAAYFCTTPGEEACGYDGRFIGSCTLGRQAAAIPIAAFLYFDGVAGRGPAWGGDDLFADYCPYVRPYETNGFCSTYDDGVNRTRADFEGMSFGEMMYCFPSAIAPSGYAIPPAARAGCYRPVCEARGAAYVMMGDSVLNCSAAASSTNAAPIIVLRRPPVRGVNATVEAIPFPTPSAFTSWSFTFHGAINCAQAVAQCQRAPHVPPGTTVVQAGAAALVLVTDVPRLQRVSPSTVPLSGGTRVIIVGSGLSWCSGLRIGGVATASFAVYNDSVAVAITSAVNLSDETALTAFGGANEDGTGPALVQLICRVIPSFRGRSDSRCTISNPCVVSSGFLVNYSGQVSSGSSGSTNDDDANVIDSVGFKFLIVAVPVVVIGAVVIAVRRRFAARDAADGEAPISDGSDDDGDQLTKSRRARTAPRIRAMPSRPTGSLFGEGLAQPLAVVPPPEDGTDTEMVAFTEPMHPRELTPRADVLL
jgi:hypothetical protein